MAKAEWGTKRLCQGCGARFYDLRKSPIVCPKCGATFDPVVTVRAQRARSAAAAVPKPVPVAVEEIEIEIEDDDAALDPDVADDEEDEVIEDASELGADKDDMFEVIEKPEGEDER